MKRIRKLVPALVLLVCLTFSALAAVAFSKPLDVEKITSAGARTVLYSSAGSEIHGLYSGAERIHAPISEMPSYLPEAFIAAEDSRFYEHNGVDVRRILGALWTDVRTLSFSQGASTITQQLVRLTHLSAEKTLTRKLCEAALAIRLERVMDKNSILEYYMNVAYFGSGAYGVGSAAMAYFSKPVSRLTLAESALLAGLVKAPSSYAPDTAPEKALDRRAYVLSRMLENGFITQEEHDLAQAEPLHLTPAPAPSSFSGWYADTVLDEATSLLGISAEAFLAGGYRVYTALDPAMQSSADSLFAENSRFPENAADGTAPQASLVAIEPSTGEILALVGGREYTARRALNRATSISRQPGSAFKPVSVYAAAVDSLSFVPTTVITDEQRDFGNGYSPSNAGGKFYGPVTLRTALSKSLNAASVDLLTRVGVPAAKEYAARLGLPLTRSDSGLSLALGSLTEGVSPLELCSAYSAIANSGARIPAHTIRRIESADGTLLYTFSAEKTQTMRPESASILTSMLESAVKEGSAQALLSTGFPVAAKTGTVAMETEGNRDAWIAAYTPSVAVCVWMGYDEPDSAHFLPEGTGGSSYPARLAAAFLSACASRADSGSFPLAAGLSTVSIDQKALDETHLPMLSCPYTPPSCCTEELFFAGEEPTIVSDIWHAPSMVWDLSVTTLDGYPHLSFTAEANAGYRILRICETGERTCIADITTSIADTVSLTDLSSQSPCSYTVVPYNSALAAENIDLSGQECLPVSWQPRTPLWQWLFPAATASPTFPDGDPLFGSLSH